MSSHDLSCDPVLVLQRQPGVEYYLDHAHNRFYVLTNFGSDGEYKVSTHGENLRIMETLGTQHFGEMVGGYWSFWSV